MLHPLTTKKATGERGRLDAEAWLDAAFRVLAKHGIEAVRIEPLAKSLHVTKGSFYWHFKDRPALLVAMLQAWRQRATLRVIERMERGNEPPGDRLRQLLALPRRRSSSARDGADVEAAIRLWGRSDAHAAKAILDIDRLRLGHITSLLESADDKPHRAARATLLYCLMLAQASIGSALDPEASAQCETLLLDWPAPGTAAQRIT
ncbi:MAG: TetR/AcrR family transcriptional regulator [Pseudomonadota bacterium]|nr:TetR/AcrR family transcriptional regulator [Pseudomonadota bacterium]